MTCPHSKPKESDNLLTNAGFDSWEVMLLHVARFFFLSHSTPKQPYWEVAFDLVITRCGPKRGPAVGVALIEAIRAIRTTRQTPFRFNNPNCKGCSAKITDCERHFLQIIQCLRIENQAAATVSALMLCEGKNIAPVIATCEQLAAMHPSYEVKLAAEAQAGTR